MNEHLMRALLYAALFFEVSTEEQCDPDAAVSQLEGIGGELDHLTAPEKDELRAFAYREADAYPVPGVRTQMRQLIDALLADG